MHNYSKVNKTPDQDKRKLLIMSNRWVNTIYTGYGITKQKILLEVLSELQGKIQKVMKGKKVADFNIPAGYSIPVTLDMSNIIHYNNYSQVRTAVKEMTANPVRIYNDPEYKKDIYIDAPLLNGWEPTKEKKIITLWIKKEIAELLLYVDYKPSKKTGEWRAEQFTPFDPLTITESSSKYMYPLYTMICSYAARGGFEMTVDELREHLQVEQKYFGFDNMHRHVLKHVQKLTQINGLYTFNFSLVKTGKKVTKIIFKVFKNEKLDPNHAWMKIYRQLNQELPYYMRFTDEQREQLNYLLTSNYDLEAVYNKFLYIHKALVKKKEQHDPAKNPFAYTLDSIQRQFPPPG